MISLPLIVSDPRVKTLFPNSISRAFTYQGKYVQEDTIDPGVGYWLKFADSENITIVGEPDTFLNVNVRKGWNMIGCSSVSIAVNQLEIDPCSDTIGTKIFSYGSAAGYYISDTLFPGKSAWIKVNQDGSLYERKWLKVTGLPLYAIAPHPTESNVLFGSISSDFSAGTYGAILKSTDAGASWDTLVANVDGGSIMFDPSNATTIYAGLGSVNTCRAGIIKSTDAGQTWFRADSGIVQHLDCYSAATVVLIDPNNTNIIYASAGGTDIGIQTYKSTDGGAFWFPLPIYYAVNCIPDTTIPQTEVLTYAIDPENSSVIYAGTILSDTILYWSTDGGNTWDIRHCFSVPGPTYVGISGIYVSPDNSNTIFVGGKGGFYRSTDRGVSWQTSNNGLGDLTYGIGLITTSNPNDFYCLKDSCFYRTLSGGLSWENIICNVERTWFMALDKVSKSIYVGTPSGIMRMKICL